MAERGDTVSVVKESRSSDLQDMESVYEQFQNQLRAQQDDILNQRELLLREAIQHELAGIAANSNSHPNWSFTQGLIVGQVSVILVIAIFIKFFVFAESTHTTSTASSSIKDASAIIVKREKQISDASGDEDAEVDPAQAARSKLSLILEKTYYDVDNHASESLDWFNVLIAQTISQLRTEALLLDNIYHSFNEFLAQLDMPEYLDKIRITEIDIGDDFPIFSNCRIKHSKDGTGRLEAKIDVDLSDTLTLGIETKLLLNHPRPLTAVLPVQLSVSIIRFSGCLTVSLINTNDPEFVDLSEKDAQTTPENGGSNMAPSSSTNSSSSERNKSKKSQDASAGTALMFSFSPDYRLEFVVNSLIGSRAKLQDVPKISSLIENKLRTWFIERCIEPRFQVVKLPSLWPRRKNTREPVHSNINGMVDKTEETTERAK